MTKNDKKNPEKQYSKSVLVILTTLALIVGALITTLIHTYLSQPSNEAASDQEIERKWLVNPDDLPFDIAESARDSWQIKQTYLNFSPEIRVREITEKSGKTYWMMAVKSDMTVDGMSRTEKEWYIEKDEYENLLTKTEPNTKTISKTRYSVYKDGMRYEYDIFHDQLDGLVYMEIEFDSVEEANKFVAPNYITKDVTADKRYKNQSLARFGMPKW